MTGPGVSANSALGTAQGLASKAPPLVHLPHWVRMPSNAAQHWLRYTFVTAFSAWAGIFLYRSHPFSLSTSSSTGYILSPCQHLPVHFTYPLPVNTFLYRSHSCSLSTLFFHCIICYSSSEFHPSSRGLLTLEVSLFQAKCRKSSTSMFSRNVALTDSLGLCLFAYSFQC